ncbi:methyltransferase domain-containing protein [Pseudoalteromonas obscura]|uniref:Methyltransferase domain-containing protein n=1 Tax=Pseudoalteromonas obscura TaxID=3048491 RepID=A0ABT7EJ27_9GAMM|nr:methyltransferase domain-containing protein [Pseudoalteromonas sp. P94(2023)]MDK2595066.1 methyltransferase domain-containing protein [Pseudoalteromonas sp. P94(2023)]
MSAVLKLNIADKFSRASAQYIKHANVQQRSAEILFAGLNRRYNTMLDLGAGPMQHHGVLSQKCDTLVALDLSEGMLKQGPASAMKVCADMDALPLQAESVECVFSNFAMQWSSDLPTLFSRLNTVLKAGGSAHLSIVIDGSLREIAKAWQGVDGHCHVNQFTRFEDIQQIARQAGFSIRSMSKRCLVDIYNTPREALKSVKSIGANQLNNADTRRGLVGKESYQALLKAYPLVDGFAHVSYEVAFLELTK